MKKGQSITLLSILSVLLALLMVLTFARFSVGVSDFNGVLGAIELDYDIAGGQAFEISLADDNIKEVGDDIDEVVKTIDSRLTKLGYGAHSVKAVKPVDEDVIDYDIIIEAKAPVDDNNRPDNTTLSADIQAAIAYGEVKFFGDTAADPGDDKEILKDGKVIAGAKVLDPVLDAEDQVYYQVSIEFTDYGFDTLSKLIKDNSDKYYFKIKLGDSVIFDAGTEEYSLSASHFNGKSLFISTTNQALAKQTALQLSSGGLAYKYEVVDNYAVKAPLGENFPMIATIAISALIVLIMVALIVIYRAYGVAFSLSLLAFALLETLMLIAVPGITLSLGGIIGIALATIICADGFIVIIKRIKEEFVMGKTLKSAVKVGYKRSLIPVISVSVICGVVALAIFSFASGSLQCFGITFGIGAVLSVIANLLLTRLFGTIMLTLTKYSEKSINFNREEK